MRRFRSAANLGYPLWLLVAFGPRRQCRKSPHNSATARTGENRLGGRSAISATPGAVAQRTGLDKREQPDGPSVGCGVVRHLSAWLAKSLTNETERRPRPTHTEREMPVNRKQTQRLLPSRVTNPAALITLPSRSNDASKTVRAGNVLTESGAR